MEQSRPLTQLIYSNFKSIWYYSFSLRIKELLFYNHVQWRHFLLCRGQHTRQKQPNTRLLKKASLKRREEGGGGPSLLPGIIDWPLSPVGSGCQCSIKSQGGGILKMRSLGSGCQCRVKPHGGSIPKIGGLGRGDNQLVPKFWESTLPMGFAPQEPKLIQLDHKPYDQLNLLYKSGMDVTCTLQLA